MDLHLDLGEEGGLVEQIYAQLHERIISDALPPGTVLRSSRELAARLSVSRATVVAAYERLAATGLGHAGGTQEFTGGTVNRPIRWRDRLRVPQSALGGRPLRHPDPGRGLPSEELGRRHLDIRHDQVALCW